MNSAVPAQTKPATMLLRRERSEGCLGPVAHRMDRFDYLVAVRRVGYS